MINDQDKSSLIIRLEEVYDLADKHLSQSKKDMIFTDIDNAGFNFNYVLQKTKALKSIVISGAKFDTATVYRVLGLYDKQKSEKPKGCNCCDDGYIMAIKDNEEMAFACSCELGKYRRKTEKMAFYKNEETSENYKIFKGLIDFKIDIDAIKNRLKNLGVDKAVWKEELCPF